MTATLTELDSHFIKSAVIYGHPHKDLTKEKDMADVRRESICWVSLYSILT